MYKLYNKIFVEKLIRYTEIYDMNHSDALEMFVRFNSGGRSLKKSEITMSILEAYWPSAKTEFGKLLVGAYAGFGSDFVIRAALMLYGDLNNLKDIRAYLMRAILFTYFQSGTTSKLQQMKSYINNYDYEITVDMLEQISDLRVTDGKIEDILNSEKGSRVAGEALYYLSLDWLNQNFKYEQGHLHPYERFDDSKPVAVSMEEWKRWRGNRNRLPNLQLLEGRSNGGKK